MIHRVAAAKVTKWSAPAGDLPTGAVVSSAKGPVSRILSVCGHSSRRRVAADAHQRPTRRFRQLHEAPCDETCRRDPPEPPGRIGPIRTAAWLLAGASLPIWSCSVWGLPCPRHYCRSGALLPHLFTLTPALTQRSCFRVALLPKEQGAEAVSFLWHCPSASLEAHLPDVIRHTALRSSDFPPPDARFPKPPAATARSSCQGLVYREGASTTCAWDDCARTFRWRSTSPASPLPAWDRPCAPGVPVPAAFSGS